MLSTDSVKKHITKKTVNHYFNYNNKASVVNKYTIKNQKDYSVVFNGSRTLSGNPDEFLAEENLWSYGNTLGTSFIRGDFQPANTYAARQNTNAAYIMNELPVGKLKFIYGDGY